MRIVVDAMGSDNYPQPDVAGAVLAAREFGETMVLVGDKSKIEAALAQLHTADLPLEVIHATEVVTMTDKPADVIKGKANSSMHVGMKLIRDGQAEAFVTAGNTGGALGIAMLRQVGLGRIAGVKRPALGVVFPTKERPFLIDNGANTDCKPEYLLQFGLMGSLYVERLLGIARPRVGLISTGEEEGKGNILIKEASPLLANSGLNYVGNIEPKEFMQGMVEVGVADGFTGNILMKTAEATAKYMSDAIKVGAKKKLLSILGGLLMRPVFKDIRAQLDPNEVGGALLLGVNGVVVIGHGRSNAYAMKQAIGQARRIVQKDVVGAIREGIAVNGER